MNNDSIANETDMTTRFLTEDPMAEKYYQMSPYAYCANNPILFIDPNGEEIFIYYTDDKGKQQQIQYARGMGYSGGNSFVETVIGYLNKMDKTENGHNVLGNLILSKNDFNVKNVFSKDANGNDITNQLAFTGSKNGGGDIAAAALMGNVLNDNQKLSSTAHEFFHGYQKENGESGANSGGINREVGAFLFGESISQSYQLKTFDASILSPFGNNTPQGKVYDNAMNGLLSSKNFNSTLYNIAGNNFKKGSIANTKGTYNNKIFNPNYANPLIRKFYPLVKY